MCALLLSLPFPLSHTHVPILVCAGVGVHISLSIHLYIYVCWSDASPYAHVYCVCMHVCHRCYYCGGVTEIADVVTEIADVLMNCYHYNYKHYYYPQHHLCHHHNNLLYSKYCVLYSPDTFLAAIRWSGGCYGCGKKRPHAVLFDGAFSSSFLQHCYYPTGPCGSR